MVFLHLVHVGAVTSLSFHPTGNYLVSGSADSTLKVPKSYLKNKQKLL